MNKYFKRKFKISYVCKGPGDADLRWPWVGGKRGISEQRRVRFAHVFMSALWCVSVETHARAGLKVEMKTKAEAIPTAQNRWMVQSGE